MKDILVNASYRLKTELGNYQESDSSIKYSIIYGIDYNARYRLLFIIHNTLYEKIYEEGISLNQVLLDYYRIIKLRNTGVKISAIVNDIRMEEVNDD